LGNASWDERGLVVLQHGIKAVAFEKYIVVLTQFFRLSVAGGREHCVIIIIIRA
jgi:hypothetical protein